MIGVDLEQAPFTGGFIDELVDLTTRVFGGNERASLEWRLRNMPDVTVFLARTGDRAVGFKAGYAQTETRYYSWLGGSDPAVRRQGVAAKLMAAQHDWVAATGYRLVETHVSQQNDAMIRLNLESGLRITGMFSKRGEPYFMMQREFPSG